MRVVVTGRGMVTGLGPDLAATWNGLMGLRPHDRDIGNRQAERRGMGHVDDEGLEGWLPGARVRRLMDRRGRLAFAAAHQALTEAGLRQPGAAFEERAGLTLATGHALCDANELATALVTARGFDAAGWNDAGIVAVARHVPPLSLVARFNNMAASHIAIGARLRGPSATFTDDCGGAHALGWAWRWIRCGSADVMLAGGVESRLDVLHTALRGLSAEPGNEMAGEGAGFLVLESLAHANARGARVQAEMVGYGFANEPDEDPDRLVRALDRAAVQAMADQEHQRVDVIFAARQGSPLHDQATAGLMTRRWTTAAVAAPSAVLGQTSGAGPILHSALATETLACNALPPAIDLTANREGARDRLKAQGAGSGLAAVCGASADGHQAAVVLWRRPDGPS